MKRIILISIFFLGFTSFTSINAQWARTYGGSGNDYAKSIQQTNDGGYIVAGYTYSFSAGDGDFWILKLSSNGDIDWQKTYGGSEFDGAFSIQQTSDGGYIVAGYTYSFDTDNRAAWVLKLGSNGDIEWQKSYGGNDQDSAYSIDQTSDEGYIVAGLTRSFSVGQLDFWILKLFSNGDIEWQKTYGENALERVYSVQQTSDGGYIVAGYTHSFGAEQGDFWILKLFSNGDIDWQKTYGGSGADWGPTIQQITDDGYIVAGWTDSFSSADFWILKLFSNGDIEWQKTYGGRDSYYPFSYDSASSIQQTSDTGYIVAGRTNSFRIEQYDFFVLKLYSNGDIGSSCDFIGSSDATVTDTSVSPEDTDITPQDTSVTPLDTSASVQDTDATIILPCGLPKYTLTISSAIGYSTIPPPGSYKYYSGTKVQIEAIIADGYRFLGWTGDVPSGHENDKRITITMDSDKSITANIAIIQYTLTIALESGGTTDPSPGTYNYDWWTEASITAIPDNGYEFNGWSGDASGTANPVTITMDRNKSLTANFQKKSFCFIATAAYGTPLHPYVRILGDFRNTYLMSSKPGLILVYFYYKYSPFVADLVAKHKALKIAVRISLLPLVAFSYSMLHFGPIITTIMLIMIFALPIFLISFFLGKPRRVEAKDPKAMASRD